MTKRMKMYVAALPLMLAVAGCGGGGTSGGGDTAGPPPTPTPTPTPPTPTPTPTPPTPTPTPPTPTPTTYFTISDIYSLRLGSSGVTLASACSGYAYDGEPPAPLTPSAFGQGLNFRYVITPQVWSVGGEVGFGFDNRDGDSYASALNDPFAVAANVEVGFSKLLGSEPVRFTIERPIPAGMSFGLDYVRYNSAWAPLASVRRLYQCATGVPTTAADTLAAPSGTFSRNILLATAHVRDGGVTRLYTLRSSIVTIGADIAARRVTVTLRLTGTPQGGGPDLDLGTFTTTATIDPSTGNFTGPLASSGRGVTGSISGRFFGPNAVEIGAAFGASVAAGGGSPAFTIAGGFYGAR